MYFSIKDLRSRVNRESNFKSSESQDVFSYLETQVEKSH